MTVISEGLLLNSKYIKMGREEEGFPHTATSCIVCHAVWRSSICGFATVRRA